MTNKRVSFAGLQVYNVMLMMAKGDEEVAEEDEDGEKLKVKTRKKKKRSHGEVNSSQSRRRRGTFEFYLKVNLF